MHTLHNGPFVAHIPGATVLAIHPGGCLSRLGEALHRTARPVQLNCLPCSHEESHLRLADHADKIYVGRQEQSVEERVAELEPNEVMIENVCVASNPKGVCAHVFACQERP